LEDAEKFAEFAGGVEAGFRWPEKLLSDAWLERNCVGGGIIL
jgi:hypothetical protein